MLDEVSVDYQYNVLIDILAESVATYLTNNNTKKDQEGSGSNANKQVENE